MRELVLTHLIDEIATIALVDYDKYEVAVKKVYVEDPNLEFGEIAELIKAGKIRLYRNAEHIGVQMEAWLAFDPDRGCLCVDRDGNVSVAPASEHLAQLTGRVYRCSATTSDLYKPKLLGKMETSFYKALKEAERKYGASLEDSQVRAELMNKFGITIEFKKDNYRWSKYTYLSFNLYGRTIDRLDLPDDMPFLILEIEAGHVEEIWADGEEVNININEGASVDRIKVSHRVKKLACRTSNSNEVEHPLLITDAENCALEHLEGYRRSDADLSIFKNLRFYRHCWRNYNSSKVLPLNVTLNNLDDKEFEESFIGVEIQTLLPHADGSGTFDLTGIKNMRGCFHRFSGVNHICGRVTEDIVTSFISEEFAGTFDVTMRMVVGSFAYGCKDRISYYINLEEKPLKHNPTGIIRLEVPAGTVLPHGGCSDNGVGVIHLGLTGKYEVLPWKQEQHLTYGDDDRIRKLYIALGKNLAFHIHSEVSDCSVLGGWRVSKDDIDPVFHQTVYSLSRGSFPYPNVRGYGDKCFAHHEFKPAYLCQLPEGLTSIDARAFYSSKGIDYLVIPKSCEFIGAAAFSEMKSTTSDLTTICVYRDSYAHKWSKGKKLRILVIDSVDDIPKPTSTATDSDFLAAFVETPSWADKSKPFVAKVLLMSSVDLMGFINPVCQLSPELVDFFSKEYASKPRTRTDSSGEEVPNDVYGTADGSCPDGEIPRLLLHATTLEAIYGSNLDLLNIEVLSRFTWTPKRCYDVTLWEGSPKVDSFYGAKRSVYIYLKDSAVYYVGCGTVYESRYNSIVSSPQEVLSAENLIGADVQGRLSVGSEWHSNSFNLRVHGDSFKDVALANFKDFMYNSMVFLGTSVAASSGRIKVMENDIYDIVNSKIYRFSTSIKNLGVYRGEVAKENYDEIQFIKRAEDACLQDIIIKVAKAKAAPPAFELEYCRKHRKFGIHGHNPQVESLITLLSKSGFVKKITQSVFESKISPYTAKRKRLEDGTLMCWGPATNGYTHVIAFQPPSDKFYGFEAAFDILKFVELMDSRVQGLSEYPNPDRGYMNIVNNDDLFAVTALKSSERRSYSYDNDDINKQRGLFIAFDLMSGKLVLAYGESHTTYIIFSFESAKDAREFYTEFGSKIFAPPEEYFEESFKTTIYSRYVDDGVEASVHPYRANARIGNAILALGGREPLPESTMTKGVYNETILKYGRI